jgi:DUF1680 family protein
MKQALIKPGFWYERLEINARQAIFHQWQQLVDSGCIENFRIAAGEVEGFREGFFFADSDAYKWLDAAARIWTSSQDPQLAALMDSFIELLGRAQMPDGYLFTYNQIHFPGTRWQNLQVEHELYCHGHLIEAGISHYEATGRTDLLEIVIKAADRIVADFSGKGSSFTPGHEEIEIALLRLHQATLDARYFELARQFIEQRGRMPFFALSIFRQNQSADQRGKFVQQKKQEYLAAHPSFHPFQLPAHNQVKGPKNSRLRWYVSALEGKYFQQHAPIRRQVVPVGHSVRFTYLETAATIMARASGDQTLQKALERAWERMVTRRMFVTGGIGSLAWLEGFGNDYELDPEYAYAETCAALGSMFWNWEMVQLTGQAKYSDLFEWQLYNAAAVGMGLEGTTYLYNNPLASQGGKTRVSWYSCPCCPSNLSRTWASLGKYIYSAAPGSLQIHQYISSEWNGEGLQVEMKSGLPWQGQVQVKILAAPPGLVELQLRRPSWAAGMKVKINGESATLSLGQRPEPSGEVTASGYDPRLAVFFKIQREWAAGDEVNIEFEMSVELRRAHPKVKGQQGQVAGTHGPLVYCLESVDNPGLDLFNLQLAEDSLEAVMDETLLGGVVKILGKTIDGAPLTFIPYLLWGNRGESQMTVWIKVKE